MRRAVPVVMLVLVSALALPAVSYPSSAAAQTREAAPADGLRTRVDVFEAAIRGGDFDAVISVIPPKVLSAMASRLHVTPDQMRTAAKVQAAQAMRQVEIVSFSMDVHAARPSETSSGIRYALIPTETVMELPNVGRAIARSETVGLLDGGAWYLVRIDDDKQIALLREAYPGFADVLFKPGTLDFVDE